MEILDALQDARTTQAMDLDDPIDVTDSQTSFAPSGLILAIDTNVLISCLELLKEAVEALSKFLSPPIRLLIPLIVIRELDGLKLSTRLVTLPPVQSTSRHSPVKKASSQVELSTLARQATTFILNAIASFPHLIKAQRKAESDDPAIWKTSVANADDKVLDAALYWNVRLPGQVGIVSNDKNLCVKAVAEALPAITVPPHTTFKDFLFSVHPNLAEALWTPQPSTSHFQQPFQPTIQQDEDTAMQTDFDPTPALDSNQLLSDISIQLASLIRLPLYAHFVNLLGHDTATFMLRSHPDYSTWTASTCLRLVQQHWATLEPLFLLQPASAQRSKWAKQEPDTTYRHRSAIKDALENLRQTFDPRRSTNGNLSNSYAALAASPDRWTARHWTTFLQDLELVLIKGELLVPPRQGVIEFNAWPGVEVGRATIEGWKEAARGCNTS